MKQLSPEAATGHLVPSGDLSGPKVNPASLTAQLLEKEVLPRLQSGEETYLAVAQKQPRIAILPPLPGVPWRTNSSRAPIIRQPDATRDRWRKEALLGFVYVIRGDAEFLLSRRVVACHAGNFVFFLPHTWSDKGTIARWKRSGSTQPECELLWLYLRPQEVLSHVSRWSDGEHVGTRHLFISDNRALTLAELLYEEVSFNKVSQAATQLLWLICDRVRHRIQQGSFQVTRLPAPEIPGLHSEIIEDIGQRALRYMDANLMEKMTLESVARAIFTSRARLARGFKAHTGQTFGAYLLQRRLERAQHLLSTTTYSMKEIAWRCGFPDPDYFSAAFRRTIGSTPTEFRKKIR